MNFVGFLFIQFYNWKTKKYTNITKITRYEFDATKCSWIPKIIQKINFTINWIRVVWLISTLFRHFVRQTENENDTHYIKWMVENDWLDQNILTICVSNTHRITFTNQPTNKPTERLIVCRLSMCIRVVRS